MVMYTIRQIGRPECGERSRKRATEKRTLVKAILKWNSLSLSLARTSFHQQTQTWKFVEMKLFSPLIPCAVAGNALGTFHISRRFSMCCAAGRGNRLFSEHFGRFPAIEWGPEEECCSCTQTLLLWNGELIYGPA